jgi:hypothetical protein
MTTAPFPTAVRKPRFWQRRRIWIFTLILIPVVLTVTAYFVGRYASERQLAEALAEADRLDPGWRLSDLEAKRLPFPPSDKNGVDQVARVREALPATDWHTWPFPQFESDPAYLREVRTAMDASFDTDPMAPTLLNAEQERVLRAELTRVATMVELARHMTDYPYGRYPIHSYKDLVSTLAANRVQARGVALVLQDDALLRAHDGDLRSAFQDAKASVYAGRVIGDEPTIQSQLLRIDCDTRATSILERSLACGRASEMDLFDLQKELEKEAEMPFLLTGIRGERACHDIVLEEIQRGDISFADYYRLMKVGGPFFPLERMAHDGFAYNLSILNTYLNIRNERVATLRFMNEMVELAKLPSAEMLTGLRTKEKAWEQVYAIKKVLVSLASRLATDDVRAKARLRTAYTALAAERFHLANGHWPEKLQELVPTYLHSVPDDPFDGAPLRMSRKGSALVVYSVSNDLADQGGTLLPDWTSAGSDIGFVLHDPEHRRKPGKPFVFPPRKTPPAAQPTAVPNLGR